MAAKAAADSAAQYKKRMNREQTQQERQAKRVATQKRTLASKAVAALGVHEGRIGQLVIAKELAADATEVIVLNEVRGMVALATHALKATSDYQVDQAVRFSNEDIQTLVAKAKAIK